MSTVAVLLAGGQDGAVPRVVVDLCCGTGALGLAVAVKLARAADVRLGGVELHAADLDPAAVACARRNVVPAGGHVHAGDLFAALPGSLRGRTGVLICNAPYVPTTEIAFMPAEARDHEALMALDGGADGLAILRRAAAEAGAWLAPGGVLLVETSERQAAAMAAVMTAAGLAAQVHEDDESGATVVTGAEAARREPRQVRQHWMPRTDSGRLGDTVRVPERPARGLAPDRSASRTRSIGFRA